VGRKKKKKIELRTMSSIKRIVAFGGNGFVGSTTLDMLSSRGGLEGLVSVSRSGGVPQHLQGKAVAQSVRWERGDCLDEASYENLLDGSTAVLISVGSPPLPTFDEIARQRQVTANGQTCSSVIRTCSRKGVPRIVLISATMPSWAPIGYRLGKQMAIEAAKEASASADVIVLRPSGIYGTRHTASGWPIPLGVVMFPASLLLQATEYIGLLPAMHRTMPFTRGALEPMVPVENVARVAADALVNSSLFKRNGFVEVDNHVLLKGDLSLAMQS